MGIFVEDLYRALMELRNVKYTGHEVKIAVMKPNAYTIAINNVGTQDIPINANMCIINFRKDAFDRWELMGIENGDVEISPLRYKYKKVLTND